MRRETLEQPKREQIRCNDLLSGLRRPVQPHSGQQTLFEVEPDWKDEWWGMPSFEMGDARPAHRVTINFMTREDLMEFAKRLDIRITPQSDSAWFPDHKLDEPKEWAYVDA